MQNEPRHRQVWPFVVLSLVCLPVVYAASIGPVYWAISRNFLADDSPFLAVYMPLLLAAQVSGLDAWLIWYLEWWIYRAP